jgi:hypothetical protein
MMLYSVDVKMLDGHKVLRIQGVIDFPIDGY